MANDKPIQLSPSSLDLFLECPCCFWLEKRQGIRRPPPYPYALNSAVDLLLKEEFDGYRRKQEPHPLLTAHNIPAKLFPNQDLLNQWRSNFSGIRYYDKDLDAVLVGALDDCLVNEGKYIPVDYKTRGFDITEGGESFYQNQLNCYSFLLAANEFKQPSYAYLIYFIPREVKIGGSVIFSVEVKKVSTSIEAARKTFEKAALLLRGEAPTSHSECQFCSWSRNISAV